MVGNAFKVMGAILMVNHRCQSYNMVIMAQKGVHTPVSVRMNRVSREINRCSFATW